MVSSEKGLPAELGRRKTGKNIKWSPKLGSQTYGGPVVHGGQVFVGTNNEAAAQPQARPATAAC